MNVMKYLLVFSYLFLIGCSSDRVTVSNSSSSTVYDAAVEVDGSVYFIGDVLPGNEANLTLKVDSDSDVTLSFKSDSAFFSDRYGYTGKYMNLNHNFLIYNDSVSYSQKSRF